MSKKNLDKLKDRFQSGPQNPQQLSKNNMPTSQSIFQVDEQEEEEEIPNAYIPKGAKMSKNIGRFTPTSSGPKSFGKSNTLGFTVQQQTWNSFESKQHPLYRPVTKYFSDKEQQQKEKEEEDILEKMKEKSKDELKISELKKLVLIIKSEKSKQKLCLLCKRKFANQIHFNQHELNSELHKRNKILKKL